MNDKTREAMQQALEALEQWKLCCDPSEAGNWPDEDEAAITALREALDSDEEDKDTAYMLGFSDGKQYAHKHEQPVATEQEEGYYDGFRCGAETMRLVLGQSTNPEPMYINQACAERGCACHYSVEVDGEPVAVYTTPQPVKEVPEGYALISIDALKAWGKYDEVRNACQFPAEQAEQEPVAWVAEDVCDGQFINGRKRRIWWECMDGKGMAIYAAPVRTKDPCHPLQDLTDDEIEEIGKSYFDEWSFGFARAVIAADREKNK